MTNRTLFFNWYVCLLCDNYFQFLYSAVQFNPLNNMLRSLINFFNPNTRHLLALRLFLSVKSSSIKSFKFSTTDFPQAHNDKKKPGTSELIGCCQQASSSRVGRSRRRVRSEMAFNTS